MVLRDKPRLFPASNLKLASSGATSHRDGFELLDSAPNPSRSGLGTSERASGRESQQSVSEERRLSMEVSQGGGHKRLDIVHVVLSQGGGEVVLDAEARQSRRLPSTNVVARFVPHLVTSRTWFVHSATSSTPSSGTLDSHRPLRSLTNEDPGRLSHLNSSRGVPGSG